ncbi:MAG: hypothetical protein ACYTE3_24710, partial [Planctomycetota bacterium]
STKTFTPGDLVPGTTYYWRVDEFDGRATYKGKVWSFTVSDAPESRQVKGGRLRTEASHTIFRTVSLALRANSRYNAILRSGTPSVV